MIRPLALTTTQRPLVGQEMPFIWLPPIPFIVHADTPPVGLLDVTATPLASLSSATAKHRPVVGHETPLNDPALLRSAIFQAGAPPTGLVEVTTLPNSSTATQKVVVGHETLERKQDA